MLQDGMMAFALLGAGWVLWLLVALSVVCLGVSIERAVYLARDGTPRETLASALEGLLGGGTPVELGARLRDAGGLEARVITAGLDAAPLGREAAEKAMSGTIAGERLRMERGLAILATVGSNAPFVGLFGTVLGIIQAFHDLAISNAQASEAVMAGISEALVATAVGLMVAIPSVVLYNAFTRWNRNRLGRAESLGNLVLSRIGEEAIELPASPGGEASSERAASAHGR